jgi:hypothetical protein
MDVRLMVHSTLRAAVGNWRLTAGLGTTALKVICSLMERMDPEHAVGRRTKLDDDND